MIWSCYDFNQPWQSSSDDFRTWKGIFLFSQTKIMIHMYMDVKPTRTVESWPVIKATDCKKRDLDSNKQDGLTGPEVMFIISQVSVWTTGPRRKLKPIYGMKISEWVSRVQGNWLAKLKGFRGSFELSIYLVNPAERRWSAARGKHQGAVRI